MLLPEKLQWEQTQKKNALKNQGIVIAFSGKGDRLTRENLDENRKKDSKTNQYPLCDTETHGLKQEKTKEKFNWQKKL